MGSSIALLAIACYTGDWHIAAYAAAWIFPIALWRSARFRALLGKPPAMR